MRPGLFTTLRVVAGEALLWPDHVERLASGAVALDLGSFDPEGVAEEVARAVGGVPDCRVRITLLPGCPPRVEARSYEPPTAPWTLAPVGVSHPGDVPLLKTTARERYDEATARKGTADDALLVDPSGNILETAIANVFLLMGDGRLLTPPPSGILPGLARARVLAAARHLGIRAEETRITLREASSASACVVTNALFLAHPVSSILGLGKLDSIRLARDLREAVARMAPRIRIIRGDPRWRYP